jgi:hypothetical protein
MGSYDVSCAISGLAIGYEAQAYLIPLIPDGTTLRDTNEGWELYNYPGKETPETYRGAYFLHGDCFYQPFSLPILGHYDTYGSLEEIQEDETTQKLEAMFGVSIEDFVKILRESNKYGSSRRNERFNKAKALKGKTKGGFEILQLLSGMYVHKDIYEHLAAYEESPRYSWRPKVILPDAYDRLQQKLIKFDQPLSDADEKAKLDHHMRSILDDPMRKHPEEGEEYHLFHYVSHKWTTFQQMCRPFIKDGKLKKELCDFVRFDGNMEACNRFYFPGMYSGQDGDPGPYIALYKAALGVLGRGIAKIAEENIVDQKECKYCKQTKDEYTEDSCQECHLQYCGW